MCSGGGGWGGGQQYMNGPASSSATDGPGGQPYMGAGSYGNKMGMMPYGQPQWGFGGVPGFGSQDQRMQPMTLGPESLRPMQSYGGAGFDPYSYGGYGGGMRGLIQAMGRPGDMSPFALNRGGYGALGGRGGYTTMPVAAEQALPKPAMQTGYTMNYGTDPYGSANRGY